MPRPQNPALNDSEVDAGQCSLVPAAPTPSTLSRLVRGERMGNGPKTSQAHDQ